MNTKVDVLYIIGGGSLMDDDELRFSLRCLSRHAKNLGDVYVCGKIPPFVGGMCKVIPSTDISISGKHWNMLHKITVGIKEGNIKGDFLFSSDDHFITKDFDLTKWPRRYRGELYTEQSYEASHGKPCGKYQRAMAATRKLLEDNGLPIHNNIWHGNMWLNADYVDAVNELAEKNKSCSVYGFEPIQLFNAMYMKDHEEPMVALAQDVKAKTFEQAMQFSDVYGCFSTNDRAWMNGKLAKWFRKNYGEKCEFEK